MNKDNDWHVYIVCCHDGTFYTGIAKNLKKRIAQHNSEKGGARYTRSRQPVRLIYAESAESRSDAARREYQIKRMSPAQKRKMIEASEYSGNDGLANLGSSMISIALQSSTPVRRE